ncbi:hypothetical protein Metev_2340 (plasmid) [Methanohalobium evestigatum Z-7303]|uniref:Uncharacterized protein n=1 Tax=Methanohalobium evestigatum (strain ATCC BAA-1072 / DSM 3721 / NBRC 107634 / OCM 161 / Z-7303) TaxID=644295 RepID=D7EC30_METEZ|nr:hypothetical protein [Methanohalobium evestigatum]ADI75152.1 hypothetical protein Metev_2340 [Methanohalobium evestigatum Z-7303]
MYSDVARELDRTKNRQKTSNGDIVEYEDSNRGHIWTIEKRINSKTKKSIGTLALVIKMGLINEEDLKDIISDTLREFDYYYKLTENAVFKLDEDEVEALVMSIISGNEEKIDSLFQE